MLPAEGSGPGSPHAHREARDTRAASPMDGSPFLDSRPERNKAADRERPDRSGSSGLRETCTPATPGRETLAGRPALAAGRGPGEVSGRSADARLERFPPSRGDARHGEHAPLSHRSDGTGRRDPPGSGTAPGRPETRALGASPGMAVSLGLSTVSAGRERVFPGDQAQARPVREKGYSGSKLATMTLLVLSTSSCRFSLE